MSDYDEDSYEGSNNSDSDSESESSVPTKKPLFKPSINIQSLKKTIGDEADDSDLDDAVDEDEEDEDATVTQIGGVADFPEDEYDEVDEVNDSEDEDDSEIEINEDGEQIEKTNEPKLSKKTKTKKQQVIVDDDEDDDDDEYDENYLQKFDGELLKNYVNEFHPECLNQNYEEISKMSIVIKNSDGIIVDPLHRTIPYLTKYEKARVLGQRAKQIETGAKPLVKVPENIVDSYIIAELELREKKIPFIIRRPIPSGGCEYWSIKDLEQIAF